MNRVEYAGLICLLCGVSVLAVSTLRGQGTTTSRVPLTVERTQQSFGNAGVLEERVIEAIRSDGSTVKITQHRRADGTLMEIRDIVDLTEGRKVVVASSTQSTTTYTYTDEEIRHMRSRQFSCHGQATTDDIMGFSVVEVTTDRIGAPGTYYRDVARHAPDLGCIVLDGQLIQLEPDGSERIVKQTQVVRLSLGDPDPAYFSVPANYRELTPAEFAGAAGQSASPLVESLESTYQRIHTR
jgi:hypothetical protein